MKSKPVEQTTGGLGGYAQTLARAPNTESIPAARRTLQERLQWLLGELPVAPHRGLAPRALRDRYRAWARLGGTTLRADWQTFLALVDDVEVTPEGFLRRRGGSA